MCKWWKDGNSCTKIVFKPKIVTRVHNSNESLVMTPIEGIGIRNSMERANSMELTPLNIAAALKAKPAGKR